MLKTEDREIDEDTLMQFEKGYLWEVALSRAFGEKAAVRPEPVQLDGIWGSPDGVIEEAITPKGEVTIALATEEYKCTAIRSNKSLTDMWKWIMQTKGYCKMLGVNKCIFRILHLEFVPVYKVWELTFTQAELDENWQAILNQAKTMEGYENG